MTADVEDCNVRWLTLVMIALATILTELAIAEPGRAPLHCVLTALGLLVAPATATAWFLSRGWRPSQGLRLRRLQESPDRIDRNQATTVLLLVSLFLLPFVGQIGQVIWKGRGAMLEVVLLTALRNLGLGLGLVAFRPVFARLGAVISLFLVLVSVSLGEGQWILGLMGLYAVASTLFLILIYWNSTTLSKEEKRSRPLPWSAAVWVLAVFSLCATAVFGPSRTATALAGLVPTSGGTDWNDGEARGGVNDGDNEVSASENPQSVGFTQSEVYLDSDRPSLYDTFNDMYGEPFKVKKSERMIALPSESGKEQKELPVENLRAGREFPLVRRRPAPPTRRPGNRKAEALLYVKGPTPLHLRMVTYNHFDGSAWLEQSADEPLSSLEKEGEGAWFRLIRPNPPIYRGSQSHQLKIGLLDSGTLPAPAQLSRFRVGSVDRPDFFEWGQGGILRMAGRSAPAGTVIETESQLVDRNRLARLELPPILVSTQEYDGHHDDYAIPSRVTVLARNWSSSHSRGWRQVEAIVGRLKAGYRLERDSSLLATSRDPVADFLLRDRRGADYHFASASVILLRSLGYSARLVSGFYASPSRYDVRTRHTSIQKEDVHFWAEVMVHPGCWVTIEPSPGYELRGSSPTLTERLAGALARAACWGRDHVCAVGAAALLLVGSLYLRHELFNGLATLAWWLNSGRATRGYVLATLSLVERRSRWAGRPRPPWQTPARWYGPMTKGVALEIRDDLDRFVRLTDWILYAHEGVRNAPSWYEHDVRAMCRRVVRVWTLGRFRASATDAPQ